MIRINKKTIPDKEFRSYLKNTFHLKWYSKIDPLKVTKLQIRGAKIKSLKGIEYFTNLKELDCITPEITSLDTSKNKKLETLICECCQKIPGLDVSQNIALKELNIGDTGISELNLDSNINVEKLRINRTFITEMNIDHLNKLKEFDCMGTPMKSLNFSNNKELEELACFFCDELTSVDVKGCTNLKLIVGYNSKKLTYLHLGTHPNLKELYLKNTNIKELDTTKCPSLHTVEYNQSTKVINKEYMNYYTQSFIDISQHLHTIGGADASDEWSRGYDEAIDNMYDELKYFSYKNSKIDYDLYEKMMEDLEYKPELEDLKKMDLESKITIPAYREGIKDILKLLNGKNVTISLDKEPQEFAESYNGILLEVKNSLINVLHTEEIENDNSMQKVIDHSHALEI